MDCGRLINLIKTWDGEVCIFGAGKFGSNWAYDMLSQTRLNVGFYCDNYCAGEERNGLKVYSAQKLVECGKDVLCIVAVFGDAGLSIIEQLKSLGIENIYYLADGNPECELLQYIESNYDELSNMFPDFMDDEKYLKMRFRNRMGYEPDLNNPRTFNEKLQWLKLYDRKPLYTTMVDKVAVKKYVSDIIGADHIVPTIGVWDRFEDIDFNELPNKFVLKCTHDSGSIVICKDKSKFDVEYARKRLSIPLKYSYFWPDREWPYKNVPRRIICEEYIESENEVLDVYKIFNFMGEPRLIQMIQDDKTEHETIDYFDTNWNLLDLRQNFPNSEVHRQKPECLDKMLDYARLLSKDIPSVRTDFYIAYDRILFSEFTFFSDSGCERFYPDEWDLKLGNYIILPQKK